MTVALNGQQLEQIKDIFGEAISLPRDQRNAFVRDASDGDALIQAQLLTLLDAHDASDGYFERMSEELLGPVLASADYDARDDAAPSDGKVSHYEVLERIGSGGMGVVHKARDTQLGRTVALKFLPRHHASNPAAQARLLAEARAASRIDHPNIGVVYEVGEADDGRQFIAMAWYDGETLKDRIRRDPVPIAEAASIALQLGEALAAAHREGMIHRDVKPANVMLTRSGGVKLVDFGIAHLITEDDNAREGVAGTIAYMSPEQTESIPLDARTDIWSLGVVVYETLTGLRPFRGESDQQLISAIRNEKPKSLASLRTDVDPDLVHVIERCLEKDRSARYQTAADLCDALKPLQVAASPLRKHRKAARAVALLALVVGSIATWHYGRSAYENRAAMLAPERSIAVLPFTDRYPGDTSFLADAIAEDLRSDLSRLRPIVVPSYLSSIGYAATKKPASQIQKEMGADYLVTGSLQHSTANHGFNLRIVDARTGVERLSKHYAASPGRIDIVREAARDVVAALAIPLTQEQRDELNHDRTTNPAAYELYLRGLHAEILGIPRAAFGMTSLNSIRSAQGFYAQSRTLDPGFSAVRARLGRSHMSSVEAYDTTSARLEQARLEAEAALRIDPQLPEPHATLSEYWDRTGDTEKSIEELRRGLASTPGNVSLLIALGAQYFAAGRSEEGLVQLVRAGQLDPRNPIAAANTATGYGRMQRDAEALEAFNRSIEISPNDNEVRLIKGQFYLKWKGTPDTLIAELKRMSPDWDDRGMATFAWYTALRMQRKYREGLTILDKSKTELSRDGLVYYPKSLMRADMLYGLGEMAAARIYYGRARREMSDSAATKPNDASIRAALALANAGLDQRNDAVADAQQAMDLARVAKNTLGATATLGIAVQVYGRVGDLDRAFETLELLFAMPAGRDATIRYLQVWPGYDPLRKDPRFNKLLARFGGK